MCFVPHTRKYGPCVARFLISQTLSGTHFPRLQAHAGVLHFGCLFVLADACQHSFEITVVPLLAG